ncbi:MAG: cell wall-binding repeat-containing protein [Euryarchaeota archaeon]|nr:cell wall-binding repeat-containing protein [Euryarchaeota archaeon]
MPLAQRLGVLYRIIGIVLIFLSLFSYPCLAQEKKFDVIIVRSDISIDWIVAQAYAQKMKIPILTAEEDYLSQEAQIELYGYKQFGWTKILVIGGSNAVSDNIVNELKASGFEIQRIWGLHRYETAAKVAVELWQNPKTVVVTDGEKFEATLAAARIARELEAPILLIKKDDLTEDTRRALLEYLKPDEAIIIGPVSESVEKELRGIAKKVTLIGRDIESTQLLERTKFPIWKDPKLMAVLGLISGIVLSVLIVFGVSFIRTRRLKAKEHLPIALLTEEERKVVDEIIRAGGILKQENLPDLTGFSRPKISRLISDLEVRGILVREKDGKSYRLSFEKRFKT